MSGWIKIHRKIKDHWIFTERRVYSKFEAWNYILLSCAFEDRRIMTGTHLIDVKRGQLITTEAILMDRFQWSKSKLRTFLKILIDDEMIIRESDRKKTILTVVKYEDYQVQETIIIQDPEKPKTQKKPTEQKTNTIDQRKEKFKNDLQEFVSMYDQSLISKFFDYWSELNKSGTKMKWELQQTFQLNLRLSTWARNDRNYNNSKTPQNGTKKPNADDLLEQQRNSILGEIFPETQSDDSRGGGSGFEAGYTQHEEVE
jgi:hypothetical protein